MILHATVWKFWGNAFFRPEACTRGGTKEVVAYRRIEPTTLNLSTNQDWYKAVVNNRRRFKPFLVSLHQLQQKKVKNSGEKNELKFKKRQGVPLGFFFNFFGAIFFNGSLLSRIRSDWGSLKMLEPVSVAHDLSDLTYSDWGSPPGRKVWRGSRWHELLQAATARTNDLIYTSLVHASTPKGQIRPNINFQK